MGATVVVVDVSPRSLGSSRPSARDHRRPEEDEGDQDEGTSVGRGYGVTWSANAVDTIVPPCRAGRSGSGPRYHSPTAARRLAPTMFGPLNGVRTALVIGAAIAALLAGVLGQWMVTVVLMLGVAVHGLGWLYLYRHRPGGEA